MTLFGQERPGAFARRVFFWAGVYGLAALVPLYFQEMKFGNDFPPAITHAEFFYGFLGVGVAWQVAFLVIARDPVRYRLLMVPAMIEKFSYVAAAIVLHVQARISPLMFAGAFGDAALLVLFLLAFLRTPA